MPATTMKKMVTAMKSAASKVAAKEPAKSMKSRSASVTIVKPKAGRSKSKPTAMKKKAAPARPAASEDTDSVAEASEGSGSLEASEDVGASKRKKQILLYMSSLIVVIALVGLWFGFFLFGLGSWGSALQVLDDKLQAASVYVNQKLAQGLASVKTKASEASAAAAKTTGLGKTKATVEAGVVGGRSAVPVPPPPPPSSEPAVKAPPPPPTPQQPSKGNGAKGSTGNGGGIPRSTKGGNGKGAMP
ncbi:unnamed protein product [Amoebophrya sp. A25]|nr:unnamed protein product [Amoebophrya sp. A25]|eukprot:GSA25T00016032001.1